VNALFLQNAVSKRQLFVLSAGAVIALVVFVLSSLAPLNHNDFMYAAAPAVWAQNGALYADVPFVQAPLSILLNSLLVAVTGHVNVFLLGRAVSMLLVLLAVLLPVLNRSKIRNIEIWLLYVALCLTNLFVIANSSEIGNYAISLLCLSAAVTVINATGSPLWRGFAACACAGLAVSAKLYFIIICPALFIFFLVNERSARDPIVIAACGLGFLVGFAPIIFFLARDYQSFLRWNVQIHQLILPTRVADATVAFLRITKFITIFVALMLIPIGFIIVATRKAWHRGDLELHKELARLLLLVSACVMAISPIYVFEQYLGPLAFLLFLFSAPWNSKRGRTRALYLILAGVMLCMQGVIMAQLISRHVMPDGNLAVAQVLEMQNNARQIVVNDYKCERKLYTAEPLFLLENDVKYPPELAAGPFLMFLRSEALAQKGEQFDLDAHIKKWNPDVVIWGYYLGSPERSEDAVDSIIRDYAINHAFVVTTLGHIDGHVIELGYRAGCKGPHP
jgi:hypothetical protein